MIELILDEISESEFSEKKTEGMGKTLKFINDYGMGSVLFCSDELIQFQYFKKPEITV